MTDTTYATKRALAKCGEATALLNRAAETRESQWMHHAISCYGEAMELDPELLEPYLALAELCLYYEQPEQALPLVRKALELNAEDARAVALWADLQLLLDEPDENAGKEQGAV